MPDAAASRPAKVSSAPMSGRLLPIKATGIDYEAGGQRLLDGVEFEIAGAGVTVVMGPNGAGKSLLLRILHGMITPSAGSVLWGGATLDESIRRRQAMVFQRPVLLRRSVAANMAFALRLRGGHARQLGAELLERVRLSKHGRRPARLLSVGEQQRLALARALVMEPDVVFFDEPTASLDPASEAIIEELVGETSANGTKVVFVTHDVAQAHRLADDVVFLHHGRVCEHTAATEFFTDPASPQATDYLAGRLVI
jgi:tungstate transport system ATP-binding protein